MLRRGGGGRRRKRRKAQKAGGEGRGPHGRVASALDIAEIRFKPQPPSPHRSLCRQCRRLLPPHPQPPPQLVSPVPPPPPAPSWASWSTKKDKAGHEEVVTKKLKQKPGGNALEDQIIQISLFAANQDFYKPKDGCAAAPKPPTQTCDERSKPIVLGAPFLLNLSVRRLLIRVLPACV
jgi:hypothetical protein